MGFLIAHGFTRVTKDDSSFWSLWVQYASETAAVRISKSNEFRRSEVQLIRLVEGKVPPYPIWITADRIDWTLLDNVLEARRPDLQHAALPMTGLQDRDIDLQLAFWANALRDTCSDFLAGDFGAIDEAGDIVRERVREHPQEIVAWLPEDAPASADASAVRDMAATVPPEVGVRVRRYRRKDKN
ncbi:MAG: hypothetical protein M3P04_03435 [Actinomycetota bacterium]|nr:hypothetical protein [Actinomycetota bacterium]